MGRKTKSNFKMSGPSLYEKLNIQRNGYASASDGRANSSAFQYQSPLSKKVKQEGLAESSAFQQTDDDLKEWLIQEMGFLPNDPELDQMIETGAYDINNPDFMKWFKEKDVPAEPDQEYDPWTRSLMGQHVGYGHGMETGPTQMKKRLKRHLKTQKV